MAAKKKPAVPASDPLAVVSGFVAAGDGQQQKLLNDRIRLGIVSGLAVTDRLSFRELRDLMAVSDGNLSSHARKLEQAGYIGVHKSFEGRVPKTSFSLTPDGRAALHNYLQHMEALLKVAGEQCS